MTGTNGSRRAAAIEEELKILYERVALLKVEYNNISPITVLPNELLIQIFSGIPTYARFHSRRPVRQI
ncbi:hypothetical protein K438DRAFT_126412 [Mycena galopus ATCC 62051]|nr:hypothetical protein K438DRAFT_126412 [Mycena galopus ATCC 62051]